MTEQENTSVSMSEYKNAFPYTDPSAKIKAVTAIKYFQTGENERDIFEIATQGVENPYTSNLLSTIEAKNQQNILLGTAVRFVANSKNGKDLYKNDNFRKTVIQPIRNWKCHEQTPTNEIEKIFEIKKDLQKSLSGVLWTLYKDEMKNDGFNESSDFARYLFPGEEITPFDYNEGLITDTKSQLAQ